MLRPKIGLDWDDVIAPFNDVAIAMANEKYNIEPPLTLEDVTSWNNTGRASVIKEFYQMDELYHSQVVTEKTKRCVRQLMKIADVYIITAAYPKFMGIRAKQILTEFPEIPESRIILGSAKNLVQLDIILDDAIHNVLESPATYPVLMRKPWNWQMTGILSVNNLSEFVLLVKQIMNAAMHKTQEIKEPSVLALVGPSGSGKTQICQELCKDPRFTNPKTYCTKQSDKHYYLPKEEFDKQDFFENTRYAGIQYGTKKEDIQAVLDEGLYAVMPLDMCGAIAMKRHFPTSIIYISKEKEALIRDIIEEDYSIEEKTLRILSLDAEKRNREICDYVVDNCKLDGAEKILQMVGAE